MNVIKYIDGNHLMISGIDTILHIIKVLAMMKLVYSQKLYVLAPPAAILIPYVAVHFFKFIVTLQDVN